MDISQYAVKIPEFRDLFVMEEQELKPLGRYSRNHHVEKYRAMLKYKPGTRQTFVCLIWETKVCIPYVVFPNGSIYHDGVGEIRLSANGDKDAVIIKRHGQKKFSYMDF